MSFTESILIPLEIFNKLHVSNSDSRSKKDNILNNITLDAYEKLRLIKREQFMSPNKEKGEPNKPNRLDSDIEMNFLIENVKDSLKPNARKAIELMLNYPHIIRWDKNFIVYVKNKKIDYSDIKDILSALFQTSATSADGVPGVQEVYDALIDLGANEAWFNYNSPVKEPSDRYITSDESSEDSEYELSPPPDWEMEHLPKIEISSFEHQRPFSEQDNGGQKDSLNEKSFTNYLSSNKSRVSSPQPLERSVISAKTSTLPETKHIAPQEHPAIAENMVENDIDMSQDSWNTTQSTTNNSAEGFTKNAATIKRRPLVHKQRTEQKLKYARRRVKPTSAPTRDSRIKNPPFQHKPTASFVDIKSVQATRKNSPLLQARPVVDDAASPVSVPKLKRLNYPKTSFPGRSKSGGIGGDRSKPTKLRKPKELKLITPRRLRSNKILPSGWISYKDIK